MSAPTPYRLLGSQEARVDDRSRVAIPAPMREILLRTGDKEVVVNWAISDESVWIMPHSTFDAIMENLSLAPADAAFDKSETHDLIIASTTVQELDGQGRIVIPAAARKWVGLAGAVTVQGAHDHIEIWDTDRHTARIQTLRGKTDMRRFISNSARGASFSGVRGGTPR